MRMRRFAVAVFVAMCLAAVACKKLPRRGDEAAKFGDTIPLEYGTLIAATPNSSDPRWVTLWFEKADKSIVIVGVDQHTWRVWKEPRVIERK